MLQNIQTEPSIIIPEKLGVRVSRAVEIAAAHSAQVDQEARFPHEAIAALRAENLLSILMPAELGGEEAKLGDALDACYRLARACSSTGMIYAIHQINACCIVGHAAASTWHRAFMARLVENQMLLASFGSEIETGGVARASVAPLEEAERRIVLVRNGGVIGHGAQADALVTLAHRAVSSDSHNRVLVVLEKKNYVLEKTQSWDTFGMRGTATAAFNLKAVGSPSQIIPADYEEINTQTILPIGHLMQASVWAGIACGALERARKFLRKAARTGVNLPSGTLFFTQALVKLRALRSLIDASLSRYETIRHNGNAVSGIDFQNAVALLKLDACELALETVMKALRACGMSGYRNDGDMSIARSLRDILHAPIASDTDQMLSELAASSILSDIPASIRD